MLINTSTVLAMRCPQCGKLEFHMLSRFAFSGRRQLEVKCACGAVLLVASKKRNGFYALQLPCVICEVKHQRQITGSKLWSQQLINLYCQETGVELGHLGPDKKVREAVKNHEYDLEKLIDQFDNDDYFNNSGIMYEVLNCLHDIAERNALYCQCGNDSIEVDIFPDRLELQCKDCDSINIIYAETEEDLRVIKEVEYIELARHGFKCLDSLANNGTKHKPKKKCRKRNKH
ncbi:hypothetical protein [Desulfofalx alkaliphila]|uniref:hypothetical protein n=1 Tax=Desulfofalx alkaliphila TaxID=105483 RepID=UPI0004E209C7|nr:hypothetical protein [Desulfofalx alkaliphila]